MKETTLSNEQKEILSYLKRDYLTPQKIALIRKTSVQAVYKTIRKLKDKGFISGGGLKGFNFSGSAHTKAVNYETKKRMIRLHGVSFRVEVLEKSNQYLKLLENTNIFILNGNTIKLYQNCLIIHINKDFTYTDEFKASAVCFDYFNRLLLMLENKLKIILIRLNYTKIKLLSNHYAEINNELAGDYNEKKIKLEIYSKQDGKLWFKIDNSFNLNEAETLHRDTALEDMNKIKEVFNQYRDKDVFLPLHVTNLIGQLGENQKINVHSIELLTNEMHRLVKIIKERL